MYVFRIKHVLLFFFTHNFYKYKYLIRNYFYIAIICCEYVFIITENRVSIRDFKNTIQQYLFELSHIKINVGVTIYIFFLLSSFQIVLKTYHKIIYFNVFITSYNLLIEGYN